MPATFDLFHLCTQLYLVEKVLSYLSSKKRADALHDEWCMVIYYLMCVLAYYIIIMTYSYGPR